MSFQLPVCLFVSLDWSLLLQLPNLSDIEGSLSSVPQVADQPLKTAVTLAATNGFTDCLKILLEWVSPPPPPPLPSHPPPPPLPSHPPHPPPPPLCYLFFPPSAGAHPAIEDSQRWLPLHYACVGGHLECVKAIVSHPQGRGLTGLNLAMSLAKDRGRMDIVNILKEALKK